MAGGSRCDANIETDVAGFEPQRRKASAFVARVDTVDVTVYGWCDLLEWSRAVYLVPTCACRRPVSPAVVVLASPWARDRGYLRLILQERQELRIVEVATYGEAISTISRHGASAVVCDQDLPWRDLISRMTYLYDPPRVIVIAKAPAAAFYAEVMNLGGYDILVSPFDPSEVGWVVGCACAASPLKCATRGRRPVGRSDASGAVDARHLDRSPKQRRSMPLS